MTLTPEIARAAAYDVANKQMRKAGRKEWNEDDFNLASELLQELLHGIEFARNR